jgi:outer membrane protein insertion porin family
LTGFIAGGGLGGDVQDYGISLESAKYFLLPFDIILLIKGELAVVDSWGGSDDVPIFDRLYLGGSNNLRGFDYREVGPVDEFNNPIGGSSLGYTTFEVTIPIVPRVRVAVFSDFGFVNPTAYDFSTSNLNADIGVGLQRDLPIGPIRVDYGYPIIYERFNEASGQIQL